MATAIRQEPPHHEKLTCYTDYQCRLPECVERYRAHSRERIRARRAGLYVFVDATPVRQHILRLRAAGIGPASIAATSGLSINSVLDFINAHPGQQRGRKQRTTPELAARILAVTVDNHVSRRIDSTGTVRRLRALVAIGWPLKSIARRAGLGADNISELGRRSQVFASTATKVEAAYHELRDLKPERNGVDKIQAKRARNWAARNRWPKPDYWDQYPGAIDDPHFEPMYGVTRREIVAQDAHWLMTTNGLSKAAAAERLGVDKSYVDHAFRDHPEYAPAVAA